MSRARSQSVVLTSEIKSDYHTVFLSPKNDNKNYQPVKIITINIMQSKYSNTFLNPLVYLAIEKNIAVVIRRRAKQTELQQSMQIRKHILKWCRDRIYS